MAAAKIRTTARRSVSRRTGTSPCSIRSFRVELTGNGRRLHKLVCKQWAEFQGRPSNHVRRVILLPADETKPKFVWMPVRVGEDSAAILRGGGIITPKNSHGSVTTGTALMQMDIGHESPRTSVTLMLHRKNLLGSGPNKCLASMVGSAFASRWRGPLAICAYDLSSQGHPMSASDIDIFAFTLALHHLAYCHQGCLPTTDSASFTPIQKIQGLKVNVTAPFLEQVDVPVQHPVFKSGSALPITERLLSHVRTYKYPASNTKDGSVPDVHDGTTDPAFPDIAPLRVCIDLSSTDFGKIPDSFHDDGASVLIVRPDKGICDAYTIRGISGTIRRYVAEVLVNLPPTVEAREDALEQLTAMQRSLREARGV